MMSNLEIWNKHSDIDPKFTKTITGKAYKGTSPSPQHVIWCMTDLFGPMGKGWGAHVVAEGFQPLGDEVLHWCRIEFWHTDRANTFETYGQTKALASTKSGLKSDEDAPKKSFTDALVKAASYLGIASNIFLGRWDDQKYVAQVAESFKEQPTPAEVRDRIRAALQRAKDVQALDGVWKHKATEEAFSGLPEPMQGELTKVYSEQTARVCQAPENGAQYQ